MITIECEEKDLDKISETRFDTHTINYNEDRHK